MNEKKYVQRACDRCKELYMTRIQFWASRNRFMPPQSKYCSRCRGINLRKYHVKHCVQCGREMRYSEYPRTLRKRKTCSEECNILFHRQLGKSPHWQERTLSPKAIENKAIALFERAGTGGNILGVNNCQAKYFTVMSPEGAVYKGKNLKDWVRNNGDLFNSTATVWKPIKRDDQHPIHRGNPSTRTGCLWCNASNGLAGVVNGSRSSWWGWTLPSINLKEK